MYTYIYCARYKRPYMYAYILLLHCCHTSASENALDAYTRVCSPNGKNFHACVVQKKKVVKNKFRDYNGLKSALGNFDGDAAIRCALLHGLNFVNFS